MPPSAFDYEQGYELGKQYSEAWTQLPTATLLKQLASLLEQAMPSESGQQAEWGKRAWIVGVLEGMADGLAADCNA
ncbi:MAG: hypothetical protein IRZ24_13695 [Thermogemmatispora sp.]|uniref:hypothetical protein n=1 Tax=Thermogemmatispora sp. TaxID=1968838 RepID=UPI001D7C8EB5|nr:hypothetical protein [Thermogemmatispora sp.]MBX5451117.1 hypothetical protein [Thermogemmatispora sp.]